MPPKKKAKKTQTVSLDRRAQVKLLRGRASAFTIVCGVGGKLPPKKKEKTAKTNNTNKKKSDESALAKVIANRDSASNEVIVETIESATFGELRTCFPLVFDGKLTSSNNKEWLKAVFKKEMGPPKRKAKKRSRAYLAELKELNIAVAPKPPSRLFGNHFIKIHDTRLGEEFVRKQRHPRAIEGDLLPGNSVGKRWGIIDTGVDDIHDYRLSGNRNRFSGEVIEDEAREAHYLQSLTGDDTDKEDFVWLSGVRDLDVRSTSVRFTFGFVFEK
jgi:hypothetical protein